MGIQKAAQELTLYVRAGEICGFRNHPNVKIQFDFLRMVDAKATELGVASGGYMVDGILARVGKKRMCAEAAPSRAGHDRMFESITK